MRVSVNIYPGNGQADILVNVEIFPDMPLAVLREAIKAETAHIPPDALVLYHNGLLLGDDTKTMEQLRIQDGEMLAGTIRNVAAPDVPPHQSAIPDVRRQQSVPAARPARPAMNDGEIESLRMRILGEPSMREHLRTSNPDLEAAIGNPQQWAHLYRQAERQQVEALTQRQRDIERLNSDPFDYESQATIERMIQQQAITQNLQDALEHMPEVFGRVHMLYVNVEVNGFQAKALVDSGAQATIMSPDCAEACNIKRLMDTRYSGLARGVGTARILGRVHSAAIKLGSMFLPCSFTVMEGKDVDMILGLDMLKRYQAVIDLSKDKLVIQGEEIPFLGEADIPKRTEEALAEEPVIPGPGGTAIGQRTGAILPAGHQTTQPPSPADARRPSSSATAAPQASVASLSRTTQQEAGSVEQLVNLGATRQAAIEALEAMGGNVEAAAAMLFFDS